jgi:hypothetical protein
MRHGLVQWRENDWMWERFGKMTPVKDGDLWRRIDQAMRFHQVECRTWRFDLSHEAAPAAATRVQELPQQAGGRRARIREFVLRGLAAFLAKLEGALQEMRGCLSPDARRLSSPLTASGNLR